MVHPFMQMPIYGAIWYQGQHTAEQILQFDLTYIYTSLRRFTYYTITLCPFVTHCAEIGDKMLFTKTVCSHAGESNTYNYELYGCAIQQMVDDWRATWFINSISMDPQFPFGHVQVCLQIYA